MVFIFFYFTYYGFNGSIELQNCLQCLWGNTSCDSEMCDYNSHSDTQPHVDCLLWFIETFLYSSFCWRPAVTLSGTFGGLWTLLWESLLYMHAYTDRATNRSTNARTHTRAYIQKAHSVRCICKRLLQKLCSCSIAFVFEAEWRANTHTQEAETRTQTH